jgi:hypothetical protein
VGLALVLLVFLAPRLGDLELGWWGRIGRTVEVDNPNEARSSALALEVSRSPHFWVLSSHYSVMRSEPQGLSVQCSVLAA